MTIAESRSNQVSLLGSMPERKYAFQVGDRRINYRLRISARAKRIRLEVRHDEGLLVVVPEGFHLHDLPAILQSKSSWILRKLDYFESQHRDVLAASAQEAKDSDQVLYRGSYLMLKVVKKEGGKTETQVAGECLRIVTDRHADIRLRDVLGKWYLREANRVIRDRVEYWSVKFGLSYSKVSVRNQRTRWGSCSTRRNLSLNWRLILMPKEVMDYVLIHELTHLEELNHSKQFWRLVGSRCPNYQKHKRWLKRNGPALMLH